MRQRGNERIRTNRILDLAKPIQHHLVVAPRVPWNHLCFRFPVLPELCTRTFPASAGSPRPRARCLYRSAEAALRLPACPASGRRGGEELFVASTEVQMDERIALRKCAWRFNCVRMRFRVFWYGTKRFRQSRIATRIFFVARVSSVAAFKIQSYEIRGSSLQPRRKQSSKSSSIKEKTARC